MPALDYAELCRLGANCLTPGDCKVLDRTYREIKPKVSLEIGSMRGCSSMLFGMAARDCGGHHYCIEPNVTRRWSRNIQSAGLRDFVTLIAAPSPWVAPGLVPVPIDYLFIDGDHRSRWCIVDYHYWGHFVRVGGRVAFHDWCGAKGVRLHIQRAISIIREDAHLSEVDCWEGEDRGTIVFEKQAEDDPWPNCKPIKG